MAHKIYNLEDELTDDYERDEALEREMALELERAMREACATQGVAMLAC